MRIDDRGMQIHDGAYRTNGRRLALALGWFSLALGMAEVVAPGKLSRLIGARSLHPGILRAMGAREMLSGAGILFGPKAAFLRSRVAGDVIDLAMLGFASRFRDSNGAKLGVAIVAVASVTALDIVSSWQMSSVAERG